MSAAENDRLLEQPEYDRIRDIAEQIDLLAYLVAQAADGTNAVEQIPRAVDLQLPSPGLYAMLTGWSDALLSALEATDQTLPIGPMPSGPLAKGRP